MGVEKENSLKKPVNKITFLPKKRKKLFIHNLISKKEKEDRNNIEKNRLHFNIYQKKKKIWILLLEYSFISKSLHKLLKIIKNLQS